ncbi:DUF1801 domain-containing protein [Sphingobacterium faecale]|uniref:DUF1801 domain-containing protein n=1 Tax=Sphingobacterium faecale TaxID=2803775 RepID=A0ABS1R603_9SPHI|nr:DUF1801 domain-containing protein [Sphingobacterium faecale]MBL1410119.1 DUF1801 domain-containing protein [Sphingobacterium faecale]
MPQNKTVYTDQDVSLFIETITDQQKIADSHRLIEIMEGITGEQAKMFGSSIIGFGLYHYRYASGHEGQAPLLGFSPRKAAFSLYVYTGADGHSHLLEGLGKFTMGKACIYIKKLVDIDEQKLSIMMRTTLDFIEEKYQRIRS